MPTKKKGGAREGAGAPPKYGEAMSRYQVILDDDTVAKLRALGDGNLSAGIRTAARRVK